nr:hypothetical protein [Thiomicrospira aerophila]
MARNVDSTCCRYRAELAQARTDKRRSTADKSRITDEQIIRLIEQRLTAHHWSPWLNVKQV